MGCDEPVTASIQKGDRGEGLPDFGGGTGWPKSHIALPTSKSSNVFRPNLAATPKEIRMAAATLQYVFKPNPGADLGELVGLVKESAKLWKEHGADVSFWTVQVGEIGNMAFVARFESSAKLGATLEALNADPAFMAWRAKSIKSGLATWVRSNQLSEVPLS